MNPIVSLLSLRPETDKSFIFYHQTDPNPTEFNIVYYRFILKKAMMGKKVIQIVASTDHNLSSSNSDTKQSGEYDVGMYDLSQNEYICTLLDPSIYEITFDNNLIIKKVLSSTRAEAKEKENKKTFIMTVNKHIFAFLFMSMLAAERGKKEHTRDIIERDSILQKNIIRLYLHGKDYTTLDRLNLKMYEEYKSIINEKSRKSS